MTVKHIEFIHPIDDLMAQFLHPDHTRALFINLIPKCDLKFKDLIGFDSDEQTMLVVLQGIDILMLVSIESVLTNEVHFCLCDRSRSSSE